MAHNVFKSAGIQGDRKEAEQGAAYTALINLGLIDSSVKFDVKTAAGTVKLDNIMPLMTRPKRNSELCLSETLNKTQCFPWGRSKCFVIPSKWK